MCRYIGLAFMFWALAGIPFTLFTINSTWRYLGMAICIVIGIIFIVLGIFVEQEEYKILRQEPLLFDYEHLKELSNTYNFRRKKYVAVAVPCTTLFVVGLLIIMMTVKGPLTWSEYHSFVFLGFAIGLSGFVYSVGVMEAYELLVKSEQYSTHFSSKIRRKIRDRIDRF